MKNYTYHRYQVDLHPYAGGFKAFTFPHNNSGTGLHLLLVGPDGQEPALLERQRDVPFALHGHLTNSTTWIH